MARDLITALAADGTYQPVGTAGTEDGSAVTTTVLLFDDEHQPCYVEVRISHVVDGAP